MKREPLGKWISILYRHSMMYANEFLKDYEINAGQLPFFINIIENPGITQEELSKKLRIDKSTTAKSIKVLIKKGYLTRKVSREDKRVHLLYPTEKAIQVKEVIFKRAFEWDEDVLLKGFSEDEKRCAYDLLRRITQNCLEYFEKKEMEG
ncbi:MarR family winged helix-turn-helix transcriptional regulator [Hippea alviniae]|uniref:MarR family winged helix-turn-helix transcriptional regulator n=1 Tax=Hippea alviniae TaxID=1279027 RepID=UPI0003FC97E5|nr:MarR family transcriptional regulator [Hippea alviniae]